MLQVHDIPMCMQAGVQKSAGGLQRFGLRQWWDNGEKLLVSDLVTISSVPHLLALPWALNLAAAYHQLLASTGYTSTPAAETSSSYYLERVIPVPELFLLSLALDFCDLKGLVCLSFLSETWAHTPFRLLPPLCSFLKWSLNSTYHSTNLYSKEIL